MPNPTSSASHASTRDVARTSAFTLELLIVIVILGVMASVAAVSMNSILERAAAATRPTDAPSLECPSTIDVTNTSAHAPQRPRPSSCPPTTAP